MRDRLIQDAGQGSEQQPIRFDSRRPQVMHVGKFYPPHMGGIETHLQGLCRELSKSVDVRVLVASDNRRRTEELLDGVQVIRVPTWLTWASTPLCPAMIAEFRRSNADIVHIHLPNPMAVMAYLASGHRGRLVVTYHSDTVRQKLLSALFKPFLAAALGHSSAIIATSPDYIRSSPVLSAYREHCHVIPLGINLDEFKAQDSSLVGDLRRQHGDRIILSVGRLVYYKGFEHLIRAMTQVQGKLIIIGEGPLWDRLHNLIGQLGLADRVLLTGGVPDSLVPYYYATDVFVLPSVARSEAFGIVQVEAMAAGLPVINTKIDSGVPFVSLHERTGLTVAPNDPQALAEAINRLLDDQQLRQTLGDAARLRARTEFSSETMAARTLALYSTILNSAG